MGELRRQNANATRKVNETNEAQKRLGYLPSHKNIFFSFTTDIMSFMTPPTQNNPHITIYVTQRRM